MYSLLIGLHDQFGLEPGRFLEYTNAEIKRDFSLEASDLSQRIKNMPALVMPEPQDQTSPQVARIGYIVEFSYGNKYINFDFSPDLSIEPISTDLIVDNMSRFGISGWELSRTHWAIKDANVHKGILQALGTRADSEPAASVTITSIRHSDSRILNFPVDKTPDPDPQQVAVMMPFGDEFEDVYEAIQGAVTQAGLSCRRVDQLSGSTAIMDDIADLLWSSGTIIADMTGMNPNVFYETGIAHTLNRKTFLITQDVEDAPFDLKHIRHLEYSNLGLGLNRLQKKLVEYLTEPL